MPNYYKFSRGTWRQGLIYGRVGFWATNLKRYPTIAEVVIVDKGNISQVFVDYEVRTAGLLVTRDKRARIVAELENLEAFVRGR